MGGVSLPGTVAAALLVAASACALPLGGAGDDARGMVVSELDAGDVSWTLRASGDATAVCLDLDLATPHGQHGIGSCGQPVPGPQGIEPPATSGGERLILMGLVGRDVHAVRVEAAAGSAGEVATIALDAAGLDARAYVVVLPAGAQVTQLVAVDRDGHDLEVVDVPVEGPVEGPGRRRSQARLRQLGGEQLRELHRVQSRALQQVVAGHEQVQ